MDSSRVFDAITGIPTRSFRTCFVFPLSREKGLESELEGPILPENRLMPYGGD
jgi:hypothetical protein